LWSLQRKLSDTEVLWYCFVSSAEQHGLRQSVSARLSAVGSTAKCLCPYQGVLVLILLMDL